MRRKKAARGDQQVEPHKGNTNYRFHQIEWQQFMKNQLDIDARKYEQRCKKNRDAIKSRWDKAKANSSEYKGIQTNTSASNQIPNENYNENENENENDNDNGDKGERTSQPTPLRI